MKGVKLTKSGVIVRLDPGLGLLSFSPYTGLFFASQEADYQEVIKWLNQKKDIENSIYKKALGPGWDLEYRLAEYPTKHLLPNSDGWRILNPAHPIVINWLLTGNCALKCKYCYAEDLMRGKCDEPGKQEVMKICKAILSFSPLAVVITGGDPLLSAHLKVALKLLYGKTGIILDTSGFGLTPKHIELISSYKVHVRISLDSEIPRVNNFLRPIAIKESSKQSAQSAVEAICNLTACNLPISVQTVATSRNRNDLESLGDKLFKLGVRAWRILIVAPSSTNYNSYKFLIGTESGQERFHNFIEQQLLSRHENGWNKGMGVQITHNKTPNSVILVSPDGTFLTESRVFPGKVVIDERYPKMPRIKKMVEMVDIHAHVDRYLGT